MTIVGPEGGRASKNGSANVLKGGSSSAARSVGGGLVIGIVTIAAVGLAGKLLSKFRKPRLCSCNSTSTPFITPANSLDKTVTGDDSDLLMHLEGEKGLPNEAVINGNSAAVAPDLDNGGSDQNETSTTTPEEEKQRDSISSYLDTDSSLGNLVDKSFSPDLQSDSCFALDSKNGNESSDERGDDYKFSTTSVALSELVNDALLDAKDDSLSENELLSKTKALTQEIKGVISRAIEDFSSSGDTSSDELTPTKLKLTVTWETNSSSGSEEEAAQVHPGEFLADEEELLPASAETESGEKTVIESIPYDAPAPEAEEEVLGVSLLSSSVPFEEKTTDEHEGTTTGGNDMERGEQLRQEEETGTSGGSEQDFPKEVMPEIQQEKMEPDGSLAPMPMDKEIAREINELSYALDDTTTLSLPEKGSSSVDEVVKKENISQVGEQLHNDAEIFKLNADTEAEIFKLTSILLRSTNTSSTEITEVDEEVDSVQISTEISDEKEGMPVTVKSSLVLPAVSHEESTVRKIVAAKGSAGAAGTQSKTTVVTTTVEFTSNTEGRLKRELKNRRGDRSSLEVLILAFIVALIAALVWSVRTGFSTQHIVG